MDLPDQDQQGREPAEEQHTTAWKVLIADDDPDVHQATALALDGIEILDRPLQLLHARSGAETIRLLREEPDVAVVLLDVVMESPDAGLKTIGHIRDQLGLNLIRIVLRTGQPGYAPELEVIARYDINDYKTKTELTRIKLVTALTNAIRSYDQLQRLQAGRQGLERIISASNEMIAETGLKAFAEGVILQIAGFLGVSPEGVVCATADWRRSVNEQVEYRIVAAAGNYRRYIDSRVEDVDDRQLAADLMRCLATRTTLINRGSLTLFFPGTQECDFAAYLESRLPPDRLDRELLDVFCRNIALCGDNVSLVSRLREAAFSDPLLHIPNRTAFVEQLQQQIRDHGPDGLAVALIDINQFAEINDMLGHHYGDILLHSLAERLQQGLTDACFVARVAGDGFAVFGDKKIVNESSLRELTAPPLMVDGERHPFTVSIGIVGLSECHECNASTLLKNAYVTLKHAKQLGLGQVAHYSLDIAEEIRGRARMLRDLRKAFDQGQLSLVYQPIVEITRDRPVGVEALLRWRTEDGTSVSPEQFVPLAEHAGLMIPMGSWVLRTALADAARLAGAGFSGLRIAVNVSATQFRQPGFPQEVRGALSASGLPAGSVELEVTENVAMQGLDEALANMHQLREDGLGLSIDDFGTGYSSLSYLNRLPATRLKIDRSFVGSLNVSHSERIVELMIPLARHLGMKVVAEGVESSDQLERLRVMGCDEVQGYWFARPMPFAELLEWLEKHK